MIIIMLLFMRCMLMHFEKQKMFDIWYDMLYINIRYLLT